MEVLNKDLYSPPSPSQELLKRSYVARNGEEQSSEIEAAKPINEEHAINDAITNSTSGLLGKNGKENSFNGTPEGRTQEYKIKNK